MLGKVGDWVLASQVGHGSWLEPTIPGIKWPPLRHALIEILSQVALAQHFSLLGLTSPIYVHVLSICC